MSGKTTFIRTTGINLLAAQTIHTCFAKKLILSPQKIFSSISIHDSLLEGKSYYLAEVLRIKKILFDTQEGANLILLDELLRGTNTVERIAGAKAIIAYMAKNPLNKILIATHDIELTSLSGANFTPVFFMEQITKDTLGFDYKINYQPSQQKNAIRILGLYGFPAEVVEEALHIANMK
jgi:DNA mismatch repair ATPase MutS